MTRCAVWWCVGCLWLGSLGCLGGTADLSIAADESLLSLTVHDADGASWPADAMPRAPRLRASFDRPPARVENRLFLVRGRATPDLLEDLADPPLRAATQRALVGLDFETHIATPVLPLAPGEDYTLVWTRGDGPPDTHPLRVSPSPAAGARLVETLPGDRDVRVPPNLRHVLLRFDGYLAFDPAAFALLDAAGTEIGAHVEVAPCDARGLPEGDCVTLTPDAPLSPGRGYEVRIADLKDATGAVLPARALGFGTRALPDETAPRIADLGCALDEQAIALGCILLRRDGIGLRTLFDEPVLLTLDGATERTAGIALGSPLSLVLTRGGTLHLAAEDVVGHKFEQALEAETRPDLPALALDEVRPDPIGPEPAQEFVELLNFGDQTIDIMRFSITSDPSETGRSIVTPLRVEPGERVLLVGPTFDPGDPSDGALPAGVRVARLDGSLSLRNDGEALYLRDPRGARVAEVTRRAPDFAGQCLGHLEGTPREQLVPDPTGGCTPGAGTREPAGREDP